MNRKNSKILPSEFLKNLLDDELTEDNTDKKSIKKIFKLRKKIDFNDPNDSITIGDNTYILLCLENCEPADHIGGILHLLDEFAKRKKIKINSFNFDKIYYPENEGKNRDFPLPDNCPLKKIFHGIWISHSSIK